MSVYTEHGREIARFQTDDVDEVGAVKELG